MSLEKLRLYFDCLKNVTHFIGIKFSNLSSAKHINSKVHMMSSVFILPINKFRCSFQMSLCPIIIKEYSITQVKEYSIKKFNKKSMSQDDSLVHLLIKLIHLILPE